MKNKLRSLLYIALIPAPTIIKRFIYNNFMGAEISKTAKIGLSYIDVSRLVMHDNATIGHFNLIRGLDLLQMGTHSVILKQNKITAIPRSANGQFLAEKDRSPSLIIGDHSAIVSKHFLDCNNQISIGEFSIIAGIGSAFFSHSININANKQETSPIRIGKYCMIGAHCCLLKGSTLPDYSVLAANSTLHTKETTKYTLYSGVPAKPVKEFDKEALFFHREKGFVD